MKIGLLLLLVVSGFIVLFIIIHKISAYKRKPKFNTKGYTILEKRLLEVFISMFDTNMVEKLKKQINYFEDKRKWRQYWEKSMSIELYEDQDISDDIKYPRRDESRIGTIRFKVNDEIFSIEFDSYDGRIGGWKIRPNPKKIQKTENIEVTNTKINNDPNEKIEVSIEKTEFKLIPDFKGLIGVISKAKTIKKAYIPLLSIQIEFFKQKINSKLPDDYVKIITQTEGAEFEDFRIYGISEIQRTGLDDADYFHLVEFDDGIIAIKEYDKNGELYYCHYSDGLIDKLGNDFEKTLIEKVLSAEPL